MASSNIILDLNQPLTTQLTNLQEHLLQRDALQQIENQLQKIHAQAPPRHQSKTYDAFNLQRSNNTIFVHGERGAGKTTFLKAIVNQYHQQMEKAPQPSILSLPLIDPTLVETRQHILVEIVTLLVRQMNDKLQCCRDETRYEKFRGQLEKMAEGLKLLNTTQQGHNGTDAIWFLDQALNQASSGQDLEQRFHAFLDTIIEILGVDLILIAVDDVDTQTTKAMEVLEVLRCYLTHPRLVVLISGDLKLYSHIVRTQKSKELDHKKDSDQKSELVSHLEQQYLAKILPMEQRIELKKLDELIRLSKTLPPKQMGSRRNRRINRAYKIEIQHPTISYFERPRLSTETIEIEKLIKEIFEQTLNIRPEHIQSHIDFIMAQPIRSILQFLKTILNLANNRQQQLQQTEKERDHAIFSPDDLIQVIYQNFLGNLVDEGIKLESMTQFQTHLNTIGYELFRIIHKHGELETGFYARPDSSYDQYSYNAAKLYFSVLITSRLKYHAKNNISTLIKLMLVGGGAANIYQTYGINIFNSNESDYLDYIGLSRNERIISLPPHFSPLILTDPKASKHGIIRTPIRIRNEKNKGKIDENSNFIKVLENINEKNKTKSRNSQIRIKSLSSLEKNHWVTQEKRWDLHDYIAAKTILASSHYILTQTESRHYISCYALLSAIGELIDPNSDRTIHDLSTINSYISPNIPQDKNTEEDENDEDDIWNESDDISYNNNHSISLTNFINAWKKSSYSISGSSLMIGKIWTRLYFSLEQISNVDIKKTTLGELFSRFIWTIINSALIEEYRYIVDVTPTQRTRISKAKNTNRSPRELVLNIQSIMLNKDEDDFYFIRTLPFTYQLICCPLLWPFLGDNESVGRDGKSLYQCIYDLLEHDDEYSKIEVSDKLLSLAEQFESVAGKAGKPETLRISALPMMGCFRGE